jgi:circadian clock protein KaiB
VRADRYQLILYVNRSTVKSTLAIANVHRMCEHYLKGRYDLEVVNIARHAQRARDAHIVAVPTLIKRLPPPYQRLVGDMSDVGLVLLGLNLTPPCQ